jgi:hypothetical protein
MFVALFVVGYLRKTTLVPGATIAATRAASQFVSRMHPCDSVFAMRDGSGVP